MILPVSIRAVPQLLSTVNVRVFWKTSLECGHYPALILERVRLPQFHSMIISGGACLRPLGWDSILAALENAIGSSTCSFGSTLSLYSTLVQSFWVQRSWHSPYNEIFLLKLHFRATWWVFVCCLVLGFFLLFHFKRTDSTTTASPMSFDFDILIAPVEWTETLVYITPTAASLVRIRVRAVRARLGWLSQIVWLAGCLDKGTNRELGVWWGFSLWKLTSN